MSAQTGDTPRSQAPANDQERLQKNFEKQQKKVQEQAVIDATNNRNQTLLGHVLRDSTEGDGKELEEFNMMRAQRMLKMLTIQDETGKAIGKCEREVQVTSRSKKDQMEVERNARDLLLKAIEKCENFINEMKDLYVTSNAAKTQLLEEEIAGHRKQEKTLETQFIKQQQQAKRNVYEEVDGKRVWRGNHYGLKHVERQKPWTDREQGAYQGTEDEPKSHKMVDTVKKEPELFGSALKPLIKETESQISEMYTVLAEAKRMDSIMKRRMEPKFKALPLERNTLTELRRYQKPPKLLHQLVQAMLLFLEFDEFTTFEWDRCKTILNPNGTKGEKGLNTRIEEFQSDRWKENPPRNVAQRANKIINSFSFNEIQKTSPAAVTLYIWVYGVLQEIGISPEDDAKGADVKEQIKCFGKKDSEKLLADYRISGQASKK